ncbi:MULTISPECIES: LCP family protein [unclassified Halanaerobium]|uniref:LCP family protein n=1 Tax=unclassified Halanaerobium TaxID=2641197 RepID=UPI000DF3A382|nr:MULTISPECIES: LCP family protein [unclassified Halanaerobium]RCW50478.1 LytR family transcriptional attenuator [Halanaerobium sp. MA284_MarDTE_T2]RCW85965.1 LytR family transcriptional attenuator [Halanaerobium sp. DL-01]
MAELNNETKKNTEADNGNKATNNKNSKNRWVWVILLALLLLFAGTAGYYLKTGDLPELVGLNDSNFEQNLNILFVGLDDEESVARGTVEADSIMIVSLRPSENKLIIEPLKSSIKYNGKKLSQNYGDNFGDIVEEIRGEKIDYHVYIDYKAFEKVIDELGGIKINLEESLRIPDLGLNLKKGNNLLSGKEALNYVRWYNYDSNNGDRLMRQKKVIDAVIAKVLDGDLFFNIKDFYTAIVNTYQSVDTDMGPALVADIYNYMKKNKDLEMIFNLPGE